MTKCVGYLAAIALATYATSCLAGGPYGSIEIGNWKGGAFTNDADGQFSHCAAGAGYKSGIYFWVAINGAGGWSLGFTNQTWKISPGTNIPIELTFDGQGQFHVFGTALYSNFVVVPMPENSELKEQFKKSRAMVALASGQLFKFDLKTTSQLLPALATCVEQARSGPLTAIHIRNSALGEPAKASGEDQGKEGGTEPSVTFDSQTTKQPQNILTPPK